MLFSYIDEIPVWIPITALIMWPTTVIILAVVLLSHHRKHWAPLREVRWVP
ncbi:MAG TPA: hypothetical protein VE172_12870 [Stackebrandtia sp.]|nr:hypothetical protein [Stackebrandtia sp.]